MRGLRCSPAVSASNARRLSSAPARWQRPSLLPWTDQPRPAPDSRRSLGGEATAAHASGPLRDRDDREGGAQPRDEQRRERPRDDADEDGRGDEVERRRSASADPGGAPPHGGAPAAFGVQAPAAARSTTATAARPTQPTTAIAAPPGSAPEPARSMSSIRSRHEHECDHADDQATGKGLAGSRARTVAAARPRHPGIDAGDGCRRPGPPAA